MPNIRRAGSSRFPVSRPMTSLMDDVAMSTIDPDQKSRRKSVAKSPRRPGEKPVKIGLYLSVDSFRRLGIKSLMDGQDKSQIVDELIKNHLPRYVVQVRSDRGGEVEAGGDELVV